MLSLVLPERRDIKASTPRTSRPLTPCHHSPSPPPSCMGGTQVQRAEWTRPTADPSTAAPAALDPSSSSSCCMALSDPPNLSFSFSFILYRRQQQHADLRRYFPAPGPSLAFSPTHHRPSPSPVCRVSFTLKPHPRLTHLCAWTALASLPPASPHPVT